jgi:hypothetical protein
LYKQFDQGTLARQFADKHARGKKHPATINVYLEGEMVTAGTKPRIKSWNEKLRL